MSSIRDQIRRNFVALVSLTVALAGFGYNTWRNELSEENRNHRTVAIELLLELGSFQRLVFQRHYDKDESISPRVGWAHVLMIRDLSTLLPTTEPQGERLRDAWQSHWSSLGENQDSADQVLTETTALRQQVLAVIASLE